MPDSNPAAFWRHLYSLAYSEGGDWLRSTVPFLTRSETLPLLRRCRYIPEARLAGAPSEKLHTLAAELLLGRAFSLMGLDVVAPRRNNDCPDLAGISRRHNYRFVADAKCMRLSRGGVSHKNFDFYALHDWRCNNRHTAEADFFSGLTPVEVEIEVRPDADDVYHFFADGRRRKTTGLGCHYLGGHSLRLDVPDGAIFVLPMYMLPRVCGKVYERCLDFDISFLTWEHVYSLLWLGVTEEDGCDLRDLFHVSKQIRQGRGTDRWRQCHLPEADRRVAAAAGVPLGQLRDGIQECVEAMRASALDELAALPTQEERRRVACLLARGGDNVECLYEERVAMDKMARRRPGLLRALRYCDDWDGLRNKRG